MAYLTESTYNRLIQNLDTTFDKVMTQEFFTTHIYNNPLLYTLFNKLYLKWIFSHFYILKNNLTLKYFKYVEVKKDSYEFVFNKGGKPTYHLFEDCKFMTKEFKDLYIPFKHLKENESFQKNNYQKYKALVEDYREWFIGNFRNEFVKNTLRNSVFVYRYNSSFANKYEELRPLHESSNLLVTEKNSGIIKIEDFNLKDFEYQIEELLYARGSLCGSSTLRILARYDFLWNKSDDEIHNYLRRVLHPKFFENYGMDNLREFLKRHYDMQKTGYTLLIEYLKWNYKFSNKQFDRLSLDNFGFKCCSVCDNKDAFSELLK